MAEQQSFSSDETDSDHKSTSSSENSLHFDDDEDFNQNVDVEGGLDIAPYRFEPEIASDDLPEVSDNDDEADEEDQRRRLTTDWCTCNNCINQEVLLENGCCRERDAVLNRIEEYNREHGGNLTCICDHPGFRSCCLDVWVLRTAYYTYRGRERQQADQGLLYTRYRYIAYRQMVRFCWGILGKDVRVALPSCMYKVIRQTFADPGGEYIGFRYPELN